MGVSLGEMNAIVSRQPSAGEGTGMMLDALDSFAVSRRFKEGRRQAMAREDMATRRQDEAERSAGASEDVARRKETTRQAELGRAVKRETFDTAWKMFQSGQTDAAVEYGKMNGFDFSKMSPEQFQAQRAALDVESKRDAARAAEEAARLQADAADEWIAASDEGLESRVDDAYAAEGAKGKKAKAKGAAAVQAMDADLDSFIAAQAAGAQASGAMGMGLPQPQQRPQMQQPQAAPVRQPSPGPRQPGPPGIEMGMGIPTRAPQGQMRTAPGPQMRTASPMSAAMGAAPSPTAFMWNGKVMDPYAQKKAMDARDLAEKIARVSAPIQRALLKQAESPSLTAKEKQTYIDFAESFPEIAKAFGGDVDKALNAMAGGEALKAVLDRDLKRDLKKKRGGGGGRSRKGLSKEWDRGYQMVEKRLSKQQFNFQGARISAQALDEALKDIASTNPAKQKAGLKALAVGREPGGRITDRDMLDILGDQNLWNTISGEQDRWTDGGLGKEVQNQLVSTVRAALARGRKKMGKIREHAELVYGSAESRRGDFGLGARAFITESFGESDEMVDMGQESGGRSRRGEAAPAPEASEPSSGLGAQYGY